MISHCIVGCIYVEDWTKREEALINNLYLGTFNLTVWLLEAQITINGPTVCSLCVPNIAISNTSKYDDYTYVLFTKNNTTHEFAIKPF